MDLSTKYMGMTLKHPVVPSASPLSQELGRYPFFGRCRRCCHHDVLAL
jgi:hypothetical protein